MPNDDRPNDDRRVRRTRRMLAEALLALTSTRPYESITIRDITEHADVGYATFFRHYGSKDDLMLEAFQEIARDLETAAGEHAGEFFQTEGQLIFQHVHDHPALYRSVLDSVVFTRKLKTVLADQIRPHAAGHPVHVELDAGMQDLAVHYMLSALVGLIDWWLAHQLQPPTEAMARIYDRLIIQATWQAMGGLAAEAERDARRL